MALGFFRRHQKMVIIIMVVLMISFLVGGQTINWLVGGRRGGGYEIGTVALDGGGELLNTEVRQAQDELTMLARLGLAEVQMLIGQAPGNADRVPLVYALLIREAEALGLEVSGPEVETRLQQVGQRLGVPEQEIGPIMTAIRSRLGPDATEDQVRGLLGRDLLVMKAIQVGSPPPMVSETEVRRLFRDMREQIKLRMVTVPASHFMEQVPDPAQEQLQSFFEKYKGRAADTYPEKDAFGFGYRVPMRVDVQWLLLQRRALRLVAGPDEDQIAKWIARNREDLVKEVPVETPETPQDNDGGAVDEDTDPDADAQAPEFETVELSTQEKRRRAEQALIDTNLQQLVSGVNSRVLEIITRFEGAEKAIYPAVVERMRYPGETMLSKPVAGAVGRQTLRQALERLRQETDVRIAFPVDVVGAISVSPDVEVSLPADVKTLGAALDELVEQLDLPAVDWWGCEGIDAAVFPVSRETGELNLFPVVQGRTGLASLEQLRGHPVLSNIDPRRAFFVRPLVSERSAGGAMELGQEAPVEEIRGGTYAGTLRWRVLEAEPSAAPETLTDELRPQVVEDWKTAQAYEKGLAELRESITRPAGMQTFAREAGLDVEETGWISRVSMGPGRRPSPTPIPHVDIPPAAVQQLREFHRKVFALAPEDPDSPGDPVGDRVAVVGSPAARTIVLLQRLNYEPALESEYRRMGDILLNMLRRQAAQGAVYEWVAWENVRRRTGFEFVRE